jgi:glycosyltransferase involved in cell wall biosynthesis
MEKISVILPVFNEEMLIERCIDSILKQTYKNLELIIVNDGSTDGTLEKIKNYNDNRIKIYSQKNQGAGQARNKGLEEATGDFICFVDSDDTINKNFLEIMSKLLKEKQAQIVACSYSRNTHKIYELKKQKAFKYLIELPEKIPMSVCGKLFRKETIKEIYFDKSNHFEDIKFAIEAFSQSDKAVYIEEKLYNYIRRNESRSSYFKSNDRMKACFENKELVSRYFPELVDSFITYSLFNSIAIANRMILNNEYDNELLENIQHTVKENIKSVKNSDYNTLKKLQIYVFDLNFRMYKKIYCFLKKVGG